MSRHSLLPSLAALAVALALPIAATAQSATPAFSDADALAAQMRVIAAQPTNVDALAQAGELSARVGDLSGASSLFARADKVDPHNGRVKAGMAEVLLRSERPGEALRFFDQAEGYGYPPARFAAERGLAYDLLGQQGRAQRDYRLVLAAAGDNAEVRRRYALSLAISGQNEAALQQLEPLIRKNDRGAWRSRAFILAMGGDAAGAGSIATTMMAPGQAQGLAPFFARLSALGPVDRAFAVHFGELRPSPQRIADARLAPALPPLAPEVVQVVHVAPVAAPAPVQTADRRHRRKGEVQVAAAAPEPTGRAAIVPAPVAAPASGTMARPAPGVVAAAPARAATRQPFYYPGSMIPHYPPRSANPPAAAVAAPAAAIAAASAPPSAPTTPASTASPSAPPRPVQVAVAQTPAASFAPPPAGMAASPAAVRSIPVIAPPIPSSSAVPGVSPAPHPSPALPASAPTSDVLLARIAEALAVPGRELAAAGAVTPVAAVAATSEPASPAAVAGRLPTDVPAEPLVVNGRLTAAGRTVTARRRRPVDAAAADDTTSATAATDRATRHPAPTEEAAGATDAGTATERPSTRRGRRAQLAAAAAGAPPADETPAAEVMTTRRDTRRTRREIAAADTAEPVPAAVRGRAGRRTADDAATPDGARGRPGHPAVDEAAADDTAAPDRKAPLRTRRGSHATDAAAADDASAPTDRRLTARERKAAAEKKAASDKKAQADRDAAEDRKARKAEPERYWVQVAGGANERDLPKAWSAARAKAPALAGHKGWTTPLRATNRVVTGPFKTDEEARTFVNTLKKQGVQAFQFTSEAGQKVSRLDGK